MSNSIKEIREEVEEIYDLINNENRGIVPPNLQIEIDLLREEIVRLNKALEREKEIYPHCPMK